MKEIIINYRENKPSHKSRRPYPCFWGCAWNTRPYHLFVGRENQGTTRRRSPTIVSAAKPDNTLIVSTCSERSGVRQGMGQRDPATARKRKQSRRRMFLVPLLVTGTRLIIGRQLTHTSPETSEHPTLISLQPATRDTSTRRYCMANPKRGGITHKVSREDIADIRTRPFTPWMTLNRHHTLA